MALIGILIREGVSQAVARASELIEWADQNQHQVLVETESAEILGQVAIGDKAEVVDRAEMVERADPIITLGGDGTLISIARLVNGASPVMIGVNFGQLGFLTEVAPDELLESVSSVISGKAFLGERSMLLATLERGGKKIFSEQAINEISVQKGTRDRLMDVRIRTAGEGLMSIRADGILFATPTGSTAYSLACGGSIVYPTLDVVLITPICAHSLTSRPLILPMEGQEISMEIPDYDGEVFINADGQVASEIQPGDVVRISKSPATVRIARSASKSYFEILKTKLNWAIANRLG